MNGMQFGRLCAVSRVRLALFIAVVLLTSCVVAQSNTESAAPRHYALSLRPQDTIATGNEWIALPTIQAGSGALSSFNVLSMRDRGLLEVTGEQGKPALQPYVLVDEKPLDFANLSWELIEYWIPVAHLTAHGLDVTLTYCAPSGSRAALIRITATNHKTEAVPITLGLKASWGALNRVTYTPVELRGERTVAEAQWMDSGEVFSFITHDTQFAWALVHPGSVGHMLVPPVVMAPTLDARKEIKLAPNETTEADFILGVGLEEFSAPHNAKALRELIHRAGADKIIEQAAEWCHARTRITGQADLDLLMNRNFLFTELYAWGKTIDTEQFVGVTSRSPRYYVSAAYWDRDAMLWSFPGLLDVDPGWAREALEYAFGIQLRNTGIHSRFIDGVVLEDGFQLDEAAAPILAAAAYVRRTKDDTFVASHRDALITIRDRLLSRFDAQTGLYSSLQDSQDEYQKQPFMIYDNVLAWRALLDLAELFDQMKDRNASEQLTKRADALRSAIMKYGISSEAPGSGGPIFVFATDGKTPVFADVPPGSLLRLPALGFVPEDDPTFVRTYEWLHSNNYKYSYANSTYGLPGSYRLPITTSWSVADHLQLRRGREQALKILRASTWDAGIVSEGIDPETAVMDRPGGAFATAAGYLAHAICVTYCQNYRP